MCCGGDNAQRSLQKINGLVYEIAAYLGLIPGVPPTLGIFTDHLVRSSTISVPLRPAPEYCTQVYFRTDDANADDAVIMRPATGFWRETRGPGTSYKLETAPKAFDISEFSLDSSYAPGDTLTRSRTTGVATLTTTVAHGLLPGQIVAITGCSDPTYNDAGATVLGTLTGDSFTYANAGPDEGATPELAIFSRTVLLYLLYFL
jgi:hypothetical protein